jgi:hypothetical protein
MNLSRPTVAQERWLILQARYPRLRAAVEGRALTGDWKTARFASRCLFFVLGLFAAAAGASLLWAMQLPAPAFIAGLVLIGVAEWLIHERRLFRSGIEEALCVAGCVLGVAQFLDLLRSGPQTLDLVLLAAALLAAGLRLLNPLVTTVCALVASVAVARAPGQAWQMPDTTAASLFCAGVAALALAAGARSFARPSHDRMVDALVIVMPVAAFVWALFGHDRAFTLYTLERPTLAALLPVALPFAFAIAGFVVGLHRRSAAPLWAMLACNLCLAIELREMTGLDLSWRLILWGTLALAAALVIDRLLRRPRRGITTASLDEGPGLLPLLQVAGAALVAPPHAPPAAASPYAGEGGGFGGGGASGRY